MYEGIFTFLLNLCSAFLSVLPSINVPESALDTLFEWLSVAAWFFPVETVFEILSVIFSLVMFRLTVSIVITVWKLIPVA